MKSMEIQRLWTNGILALPVTHCGMCPNAHKTYRKARKLGVWSTALVGIECKRLGRMVKSIMGIDPGCPLPRRENAGKRTEINNNQEGV